jgi:hypothetical protein
LGSTGWTTPTTVEANPASAEGTVVAEGDSVAGDAAEHPDSAATVHRDAAQMTDSFVRI